MHTRIAFIYLLFLIPIYISAQKEYVDKMNQFNDKGQKDGYWIEDRGFDTIELYYKDDIRSGVFKSYSKNGRLTTFGEYIDGKIAGTWYYFGDKGHLMMIQKDFSVNTDPVFLENREKYVYPHKCYAIFYYPDGSIKEEGVLLWNTDPELDDAQEYGGWKYYNETGSLIKIKDFR